jgi:hypothetical protein
MERIRLEFYRVYEPGEMQAPFIKPENGNDFLDLEMRSVPRYKDQFNFGNNSYFVHDIIYAMNANNGEYNVTIKLYRKVGFQEFEL